MTTLVHPADAGADAPSTRGLAGGALTRLLVHLGPGHAGRIAEVLVDPQRLQEHSPLQVGAHLRVVEVGGRGWRHVRIGFREYSVPPSLAARILLDTSGEPEPTADAPEAGAEATYQVLRSRHGGGIWRVVVARRDLGTIVKSQLLDSADAARAAVEALRADLAAMTTAAFRAHHRLP
jgi:hypothetical protein